jgi:molybdopterin converting factor small subunit
MAITAKIPTALRPLTENRREVPVAGATVGEALGALFDEYGGLKEQIWADGSLRRFVNVYVRGEDIRALDGLDTPIEEDDELMILPAVAGGR